MRSFGGGWGRLGLDFGFVVAEAVVWGSGVVETEREVEAGSAGVASLLVEVSVVAPLSSAPRSPA